MSASDAGTLPAVSIPKPRPYRRYLTSALHTRFVHAVLLALLNSMFLASLTGKDYFWSWFPLGPAGFKAALFTMSSLFVFVLQLATMHVGRRASTSRVAILRKTLFDLSTYQTLFWYIVSAWWFCEAYIWAVPESHHMGWVISGGSSSPDRLNERPIYLRFFFSVIAVVQSGLHIYYGQSYLHIPVERPPQTQSPESQTHPIESRQKQLQRKLPIIVTRSAVASGLATVIAPFVYKAFFRDFFWSIHLSFAKLFFNLSRSDAKPPDTYFIGAILAWAFFVGTALCFTWELAAHSFLIYLKQAPLKNGLPISANSKDPNGTLLNGLAAKRSLVKTFAYWELCLIAQKYPDRRKAIFADFERPSGPMWTSMLKTTLSVLSDIDSRILTLNSTPKEPAQPAEQQYINALPRIARDASSKPIFAGIPPASTKTQKIENFLAATNKALGQSKNPWSPPIKETQQKLLEYARPVVGPGGNDIQASVNNALKSSPVGGLFGTSVTGKINSVVLGNPAGNAAIIVDAVEAATKMLVASLNEDDFGKAVQTVPDSVKQFSRSILMIEAFVGTSCQSLKEEDRKELEEVQIVVSRLKAALRELLAAFQVFLNDAGLGIKDLNEARKASEDRPLIPQPQVPKSASQKPEMERVGQQQARQAGSREEDSVSDDPRERRTRDTAQSLRRIETQPRRQRISGGDSNVFSARDFSAGATRLHRQAETVR